MIPALKRNVRIHGSKFDLLYSIKKKIILFLVKYSLNPDWSGYYGYRYRKAR